MFSQQAKYYFPEMSPEMSTQISPVLLAIFNIMDIAHVTQKSANFVHNVNIEKKKLPQVLGFSP